VKQAHATAISIAAGRTRKSQLAFVAKSNQMAKTVKTTHKKSFIVDRCFIRHAAIKNDSGAIW
jgi:hypothetical protein